MADPTSPGGTVGAEDVKAQSEFYALLVKSTEKQKQQLELLKERADLLSLSRDVQKAELDFLSENLLNLQQNEKLYKSFGANLKEIEEAQKAVAEQQAINNEYLSEMGEVAQDDIDRLKQLKEQLAQIQKASEAGNEKLVAYIKEQTMFKGEQIKVFDDEEGRYRDLADILESNINDEEKRTKYLERGRGVIKDIQETEEKTFGISKKVTDLFGMKADFSETSAGFAVDMFQRFKQAQKAGVKIPELLKNTFLQGANLKNILGNVVDEIKAMVIQLDSVGKKLGATTGMGAIFNREILTTLDATVAGGGTMEEASAAISGLATGFSKFNPAAEATNELLATTVVRLGKIGVGTDQAAKSIDFFVRNMRMSETAAADLTVELSLMGQQMGLTSSQIISDFQSVSNDLSVYGQDAIDVFKDLEAQAKATGMQISALVGLAKQFDTFDQAADKAAQLNAVLGTQLSSLELMNMQYDERVNYIRQEVSFAVGNLENMDQYTQQFVAQALGVSSVAEAQKLLNMSQSEYLKYQNDMASANKRQEDLATLTKELVPAMDQFKIALMRIALKLSPLITALTHLLGIIEPIMTILVSMAEVALYVAAAYGIWKVALIAFNTVLYINQVGIAAVGYQLLIISTQAIATAIASFASLTSGVTLFGIALNATALRLTIIVGLFYGLFKVLGLQINPVFAAVFQFMATGVVMLGAAFNTIQGPAMLAMLVFSLMAATLALLVYSMKELISTLVDSGGGLFNAAGGLYAVSGGITALAASMLALGPIGMSKLVILGDSMKKIGDGFKNTADGMERISKMSTALSSLGDNGLIAISAEGNKINAMMGAGEVFNNFSAGKVQVDVNMPDQKTPNIDLKVELMGKEIMAMIKSVVAGGGA